MNDNHYRIDFQREYEFLLSQERFRRMVEDDEFLDVTEDDVISLLRKMERATRPRSENINIRQKYDSFIHDSEKAFMVIAMSFMNSQSAVLEFYTQIHPCYTVYTKRLVLVNQRRLNHIGTWNNRRL